MSVPTMPRRPIIGAGIVPFHLDGNIFLLASRSSFTRTDGEVWAYNTETGVWRKYNTLGSRNGPSVTLRACAVVGKNKEVFMFGGFDLEGRAKNSLWKLRIRGEDDCIWDIIRTANRAMSPSPRFCHSGWEFQGELWVFAGLGCHPKRFLKRNGHVTKYSTTSRPVQFCNNQLLCYNPGQGWSNPHCFGRVPSPRCFHGTAKLDDDVWLFGGENSSGYLDDLYVLKMTSLTWTYIQTSVPRCLQRMGCSFTPLTDTLIALHAGMIWTEMAVIRVRNSANDTWIFNTLTRQWSKHQGSKDCKRCMHVAVQCPNNTIYIVGGLRSDGEVNDIFQIKLEPSRLREMVMEAVNQHRTILNLKLLPNAFQKELSLMNTN